MKMYLYHAGKKEKSIKQEAGFSADELFLDQVSDMQSWAWIVCQAFDNLARDHVVR